MANTINLNVLEKFECIGAQCPDHCCGEWQVIIDDEVLQRWQAIPALAKTIASQTGILEGDQKQRRVMHKGEDGLCIQLDQQGLCQIQSNYGHTALPAICQQYPRKSFSINGVDVHTAMLSCPEILRLALFDSNGINLFDNFKQMLTSSGFSSSQDQLNITLARYMQDVMQQKKYFLRYRLYLVACSLADVVTCLSEPKQGEDPNYQVQKLLSKPKDQLYELNLLNKSGKLGLSDADFVSYWSAIYDISLTRNIKCLSSITSHSALLLNLEQNGSGSITINEQCMQLKSAFQAAQAQLSRHHLHLYERYVGLSLFNRGYPLMPYAKNQLLTMASALISFSITGLFIAAVIDQRGSISDAELSEIIWKVERKTSHSDGLYDIIRENPHFLELKEYASALLYLF